MSSNDKFTCMSPYITYRVYSQSNPRKWEENQGEARKFDRSGRGSKQRKRYVLNFVINRTRGHLVCTLQKPCHIPACAVYKQFLYQAAFSLNRSSSLSLFSFWYSKLLIFFLSHSTLSFHFFFSFCHVENSWSVNLWRAKLTQGLGPVATKPQHRN